MTEFNENRNVNSGTNLYGPSFFHCRQLFQWLLGGKVSLSKKAKFEGQLVGSAIFYESK